MIYGYSDVSKEPLSDEKVKDLLRKYRLGDKEAYKEIVFSNIRLIKYIIGKKFSHSPYDKEELYASGKYGLLKAIETFSFEKNIKFVTYAGKCIYTEMLKFIRKELKNRIRTISIIDYLESFESRVSEDMEDEFEDKEEVFIDRNITFEDEICYQEFSKYIPIIIDEISYKRNRDILKSYLGISNNQVSRSNLAIEYKLSPAQITRIISEGLSYIASRLEELGLIELSNKEKQFEGKRAKSLTEFFECTEEELYNMFNSLTFEEQELLRYRNGWDLKSFNQGKFTDSNLEKKYYYLVGKCRKLIKLARFKEAKQRETMDIEDTRSLLETEEMVLTKVPVIGINMH